MKELLQHQAAGIEYARERFNTDIEEQRGGLIAHDQGLGKTAQAIKVIQRLGEWGLLPLPLPILVLCPNNAKGVWENEYDDWAKESLLDLVILDSARTMSFSARD